MWSTGSAWESRERALRGHRDRAALWFAAEVVSRFQGHPVSSLGQNAEGPPAWAPALPPPGFVGQAPVTPGEGLCLQPSGQRLTHWREG